MEKQGKYLFSVVVPAYKQEKTIEKDLRRIKNVLDKIRYDYEIIVVVDGKVDRTYSNAKRVKSDKIQVVGYKENKGKGYAVKYGMARTKGKAVAFIDAGMDLDPNGVSMLLEHFEWYNADIIVGSKRHPVSQVEGYPLDRRLLSLAGQVLVRLLFNLKIRDTQAGMKIFKRSVLKRVLPRVLVKKFAFDIEMLVVANKLGFRRIFEAPIRMRWNEEASLLSRALTRNIVDTLLDTVAIFYRLKIMRYYDDINSDQWSLDPDLNFQVEKAPKI